jgi:penicillin-binding protein 1A
MVYTKGLKIYSTMDSTAQNVIAEEFKDSSNFPTVSAINHTDENGNMLNNDDEIALYNFEHYFDEDGNFTLGPDEVSFNSDGSVTINKGKNLNIYETQVEEGTDYSLEFKNYYVVEDNQVYSIQGGYINIPATYKSLDSNGNLVIAPEYFTDYDGDMRKDGDSLIITDDAYSLATKTLQPQGAMVVVGVGTGHAGAHLVGGVVGKERAQHVACRGMVALRADAA